MRISIELDPVDEAAIVAAADNVSIPPADSSRYAHQEAQNKTAALKRRLEGIARKVHIALRPDDKV